MLIAGTADPSDSSVTSGWAADRHRISVWALQQLIGKRMHLDLLWLPRCRGVWRVLGVSTLSLTVSPWWNHTVPAEDLLWGASGGARVVNKNIARAAMGVLVYAVPSAFLPERGRGS